jgi:hypothetical protein
MDDVLSAMAVGRFRHQAMIDALTGGEREIAVVVRCRPAKFATRRVSEDNVDLSGRNIAGKISATLDRRALRQGEDVQLVGKHRGGAKQEQRQH